MSTRVVAHRGHSWAARENTPAAFRAAVEAKADAIELDLRTTRDGVSVVLHDETLLRLWGEPRRVDEMTAADVVAVGHGEVCIPTLEQALDLIDGCNRELGRSAAVLIDTVDPADVRAAAPVVAATATSLETSWCGDPAAMHQVRELLPTARVAFNHPGGPLDLDQVHRLGAATVNVEWVHLTPALVDQTHRLGLELATWTINDAAAMTLALDLGVDSITTDDPRLLRRLVRKGTSPLALAWRGPDELASRAGIDAELARCLVVARDLAEWANDFTASSAPAQVGTKKHAADLVTEVDLAVERHVRQEIAARLGEHHLVVGEELGGEPLADRPVWYLDPVDGTTNLANGLPWTSMSLALALDGQPVVAAVSQPANGHVFLAGKGLGATLDGRPLRLRRREGLAGATVLTELDAHAMWPGMATFLDGLAQQHCTPRVMGSGTLALTGVAAGWAVAGVVHRFNPIDHLAGVLIAHEAGAEVVTRDGAATLFPGPEPVVVAAPGAAGAVLRALDR